MAMAGMDLAGIGAVMLGVAASAGVAAEAGMDGLGAVPAGMAAVGMAVAGMAVAGMAAVIGGAETR